jgi:hypothetical protein
MAVKVHKKYLWYRALVFTIVNYYTFTYLNTYGITLWRSKCTKNKNTYLKFLWYRALVFTKFLYL